MSAIGAAAFYAGLNIIILFVLAFLVVRQRQKLKVSIGDGGHEPLIRAIRAHGNATEYAPAAIAGLVALALAGAPAWVVHVGGAVFTLGRIAHGYGISGNAGVSAGRMVGMVASWTGFLWIGIACVVIAHL